MAAAEAIEGTLGALTNRIAQSEDVLSGLVRISTPDGFGAEFVAPALVRLQQGHPLLNVEMLSATRKVSQNRSGVDLEVVVGNLDVSNAQTIFLSNYFLRLYASPQYARDHGLPVTLDDVRRRLCLLRGIGTAGRRTWPPLHAASRAALQLPGHQHLRATGGCAARRRDRPAAQLPGGRRPRFPAGAAG